MWNETNQWPMPPVPPGLPLRTALRMGAEAVSALVATAALMAGHRALSVLGPRLGESYAKMDEQDTLRIAAKYDDKYRNEATEIIDEGKPDQQWRAQPLMNQHERSGDMFRGALISLAPMSAERTRRERFTLYSAVLPQPPWAPHSR